MKFAESLFKRLKENHTDDRLKEISLYIDESLRGYPDRTRYTDVYGAHIWQCHSPLFTFQISLQKQKLRYRFQITFFCKTVFQFRIRRALSGPTMKVDRTAGKQTKRLLAEKEMPALIGRLHFYDSMEISPTAVTGRKIFSDIPGLSEWPRTLGASITFVRFLLDYEDRKESTKGGEALCPYCRSPITAQDESVSCIQCRTIHHRPCWNETDRCSVFGCGSKSELQL